MKKKTYKKSTRQRLRNRWRNMHERCYDEKNHVCQRLKRGWTPEEAIQPSTHWNAKA